MNEGLLLTGANETAEAVSVSNHCAYGLAQTGMVLKPKSGAFLIWGTPNTPGEMLICLLQFLWYLLV